MYNLNCKITVRRSIATQTATGGLIETVVGGWNKWAQIEQRSGNVNSAYQQDKWVYDVKITMRSEQNRPTKSNDTIIYNNARYKINSLEIVKDGHNFFEVCRCSFIDNNVNANAPDQMDTVSVYEYTAVGNISTFTVASLIGKKVIGAFKDGTQYKVVTVAPNANEREVQFDISTGVFTWSQGFISGERATIQYYG